LTVRILGVVDAPEQRRERLQREQQVRHSLRLAAERLETAEEERIAVIAAAHRAGLSVRQIAAAVRLSPARVHQLLHTPATATGALAATVWEGGPTSAGDGSSHPLAATAALLRECSQWLERLDRGELVAVNLREPSELRTEYVPVDRAQVAQVLQRIARDLEDLTARSGAQSEGSGLSRWEHLADLRPKPTRLSPHEERAELRRQLGLDP
jgi:transposase